MTTTWAASEAVVSFPLGEWQITEDPVSPYSGVSYGAGAIVFDWSVVPNTDQAGYGIDGFGMAQDDDGITTTNVAVDRPDGTGEVAFSVTSTRGLHESIRWGASIAGMTLTWRSASTDFGADADVNYLTVAGDYYPWSGYGDFRLWYPDGIGGPLRFDFPGGSIDSTDPMGLGPQPRFAFLTTTQGSATMSPPGGFPLPLPPYPHQGYVAFTDLKFVSWDPDAFTLPVADLFLATAGGDWVPLTPLASTSGAWSEGSVTRL